MRSCLWRDLSATLCERLRLLNAMLALCTATHSSRACLDALQGFGDYFWVDVVEKIEEMAETVNQYQAQSRRLPKALREWQAYLDCRRTIDEFLEMLPLFQVRGRATHADTRGPAGDGASALAFLSSVVVQGAGRSARIHTSALGAHVFVPAPCA